MSEDANIDELAAEFMLGALPPDERAAVSARLLRDKQLAQAVSRWERRLSPLSHREPGAAPPPHIFERIMGSIAQDAVAGRDVERTTLLRKAGAWQWSAVAMAAAVAALALALGWLLANRHYASDALLFAVLERQASNPTADEPEILAGPAFVATFDAASGTLAIRQVAGRLPPPGKLYAVWLSEGGGRGAKLLGLMSRPQRRITLDLSERAVDLTSGPALVISMEDDGTARAPSEPILSRGKLERAPR